MPLKELRDRYLCKCCSKLFFYIASLKKHSQLSHPEFYAQVEGKSELICTAIKHSTKKDSSNVSEETKNNNN